MTETVTSPPATVNIYDAKTNLSKLIGRAEAGEEIIITRNGRPAARLVPLEKPKPRRLIGMWEGKVWIADDFDEFTEQDERDWYGE